MPNEVTLDTKQFETRIRLYDAKTRQVTAQALRVQGLDLEKEAKMLAPLDEGTLTRSGVTSLPKESAKEVSVTVGFHTPYAAAVHERMAPAPGANIRPGPLTLAKPATRFGPAGGHYLTRPLLGKMKTYFDAVAKAIKAVR